MEKKTDFAAGTVADARMGVRVRGPFEGRWVGDLTLPLRVYDLGMGGCLIEAQYPQLPGRQFTLELELPREGWVRLEAETIYSREDYGYAARFVEMSDDVRSRIERTLARLTSKG